MANIKDNIMKTFLREGEISLDNNDKGGFTYLGIAYNSNKTRFPIFEQILTETVSFLTKQGYKLTKLDLQNLGTSKGKTISISDYDKVLLNKHLAKQNYSKEIEKFYKKEYWDVNRIDDIISQTTSENFFDFGVNAGTSTAAKKMQQILDINVDGNFGNNSIYAINSAIVTNNFLLNLDFSIEKLKHYYNICKAPTSTNRKYLHGWLNRTFEIFEGIYTIDDIQTLIKNTSSDGLIGLNNRKGFGAYIGQKNFNNLVKFIKVYEENEKYKSSKNIEVLLKSLSSL